MSSTRVTTFRLRELSEELPARYVVVLPHLKRARLLSGAHLDRLLAESDMSSETVSRVRRRIMARLSAAGLVTMLERRIGGVRAGSAGHLYTLTTAGYRLLSLMQHHREAGHIRIRDQRVTSRLFIAHTLTISGIYVDLICASRTGSFQVARFETEPACWWQAAGGGRLHPDAYLVLDSGPYKDCWWLEIDQGTENRSRLRDKIAAYLDHAARGGLGPDGALPHVLFTTCDQERAQTIRQLAATPAGVDGGLVQVSTHDQAATLLTAELAQT